MMVKWPELPKSSYAVSNFLRCTTTFFSGGPKGKKIHNKGKLFGLRWEVVSSISSIIFKQFSFPAAEYQRIWLMKISECVVASFWIIPEGSQASLWSEGSKDILSNPSGRDPHYLPRWSKHWKNFSLKRRNRESWKWQTEMGRRQNGSQKVEI